LGVDLASVWDMASVAAFWPDTGACQAWGWIGKRAMQAQTRLPIQAWLDSGLIRCDGETIDKRSVARFLQDLGERYQVHGIGYDRWGMADFRAAADSEGCWLPDMTEFGQGFKDMAPAVSALEDAVLSRRLVHDGNPLMTWQFQNIAIDTDPAGNRKITKARSIDKVDCMVALCMAVGLAAREASGGYDFSDSVVAI
jgi:phage terminase large subunit-like protein